MSTPAATLAPWLQAPLQALLAQRGHAFVLHGASGLGQYALALALARAWLCEQPGPHGACGQCGSCHAIDVRTHADLAVLMPETEALARDWPLGEKAQAEIDDKKRKPSREIRVDAMRDTVEFAQRTSARGRGKVVLVYPAERMNHVTANALLKTLEEPPGAVRFVLATEAAHQLLPTIRSRCQGHTMAWPAAAQALQWLQDQGLAADAAGVLLRAAGGRPEEALRLAQAGLDARSWALLPKAVARGDVSALAAWAPPDALEALQKLCHDLLAVGHSAAPRFFAPEDLPAVANPRRLSGWSRELQRMARTVDHPFNAGLMIEDLVSQAHRAVRLP